MIFSSEICIVTSALLTSIVFFENYLRTIRWKKFCYPDLEKHVLIEQPLHYYTCESVKFVKKTTNLNTF